MDIERLREFAEVAKLRSFTRAAEALGVSQPSLSRHLASLEKELGFMLLERDTHGVALTPDGEEALDLCRAIVEEYDFLVGRGKRLLRVGAPVESELVHDVLLCAFLTAREHFPKADVLFVHSYFDVCEQELAQGEFDVAVSAVTRLPLSGISHRPFLALPIKTAFLHRDNPLSRKADICMADLSGMTWRTSSRNGDLSWSVSSGERLFADLGAFLHVGDPIGEPFILSENDVFLSLLGMNPDRVRRTMVGVPIIDGPSVPLDIYWRSSNRDPLLKAFLSDLFDRLDA